MKTHGGKKVEVLEDSRNITKYHGCCFVSAPCHIPFKHFSSSHFFFSLFFGRKVVESRGGEVTLALKPAIVFPPGHPANQAARSERQ